MSEPIASQRRSGWRYAAIAFGVVLAVCVAAVLSGLNLHYRWRHFDLPSDAVLATRQPLPTGSTPATEPALLDRTWLGSSPNQLNAAAGASQPAMIVEISNLGAGVYSAWLGHHPGTGGAPLAVLRPMPVGPVIQRHWLGLHALNTGPLARFGPATSLATEAMSLTRDGVTTTYPLGGLTWQPVAEDPNTCTYRCHVQIGEEHIELTKTFALDPGTARLRCTSTITPGAAAEVSLVLLGPVGLTMDYHRNDPRRLVLASPGDVPAVAMERGRLLPRARSADGRSWEPTGAEITPIAWLAVTNSYFAAFAKPLVVDASDTSPWTAAADVLMPGRDPHLADSDLTAWLRTPRIAATPDAPARFDIELVLDTQRAERWADADLAGQRAGAIRLDAGACFLHWLASPIGWLLDRLVPTLGMAGSLVVLVFVFRALFWPLEAAGRQQVITYRQQQLELAPQLAELRATHKHDETELQKKIVELYQTKNINPAAPALGCAPVLLELPIWVGLSTALNTLPQYRQMPLFAWIEDVTVPDALVPFAFPSFSLPVVGAVMGPITAINLLPLVAVTFVIIRARLTPEAVMHRRGLSTTIVRQTPTWRLILISLALLVVFYNLPAGVAFYIGFSILLLALQPWVVHGLRARSQAQAEASD